MGKSKAEQRREAIERLIKLQSVDINGLTERNDEIAYTISGCEREVTRLGNLAGRLIDLLTDDEPDERYIELPVDANGETWHVGDVTESGNVVKGMAIDNTGEWYFINTRNDIDPLSHYHYHKPTVEDVLCEFAKKMNDANFVYDRVEDTQQRIVKEYAAKLQMREVQGEA